MYRVGFNISSSSCKFGAFLSTSLTVWVGACLFSCSIFYLLMMDAVLCALLLIVLFNKSQNYMMLILGVLFVGGSFNT